MTRHEKSASFSPASFSRRAMLKAGGALVVSFGVPAGFDRAQADDAMIAAAKPPLTPDQLSSYIAVNADGTVAAFFGKMDMGHGLFVAVGQIVAEELDVPFKSVTVYMGDTATSVNQGGASGSTGLQEGGKQMRVAAAEARRVLVQMASDKLAVPADQLTVTDGVVHATADAAKKVSYAELVGGKYLQRPSRLERQIRQSALRARQGAAERSQGSQDRRPADQARGHRPKSVRPAGFLHRRQSARHGAWPDDPARHRRRRAGQGRRSLDQGHSDRQGGVEQRLPRRRRRQGVGRDQGRQRAQGRMVECGAAVPRNRRRFTITSAARRRASARSKANKPAMSTTRSSRRRK